MLYGRVVDAIAYKSLMPRNCLRLCHYHQSVTSSIALEVLESKQPRVIFISKPQESRFLSRTGKAA